MKALQDKIAYFRRKELKYGRWIEIVVFEGANGCYIKDKLKVIYRIILYFFLDICQEMSGTDQSWPSGKKLRIAVYILSTLILTAVFAINYKLYKDMKEISEGKNVSSKGISTLSKVSIGLLAGLLIITALFFGGSLSLDYDKNKVMDIILIVIVVILILVSLIFTLRGLFSSMICKTGKSVSGDNNSPSDNSEKMGNAAVVAGISALLSFGFLAIMIISTVVKNYKKNN